MSYMDRWWCPQDISPLCKLHKKCDRVLSIKDLENIKNDNYLISYKLRPACFIKFKNK